MRIMTLYVIFILFAPLSALGAEGYLETDLKDDISIALETGLTEGVRILTKANASEKSVDTAALEISLDAGDVRLILGKQSTPFGPYDEIFEEEERITGATAIFTGNIPDAIDLLEVSVFETQDIPGASARAVRILSENFLLSASGTVLDDNDVLATVGLVGTFSEQRMMWWLDGSIDHDKKHEVNLGISVKLWERWTLAGRLQESFDGDKKLQFNVGYDYDDQWRLTSDLSFEESDRVYGFTIKYLFIQ